MVLVPVTMLLDTVSGTAKIKDLPEGVLAGINISHPPLSANGHYSKVYILDEKTLSGAMLKDHQQLLLAGAAYAHIQQCARPVFFGEGILIGKNTAFYILQNTGGDFQYSIVLYYRRKR